MKKTLIDRVSGVVGGLASKLVCTALLVCLGSSLAAPSLAQAMQCDAPDVCEDFDAYTTGPIAARDSRWSLDNADALVVGDSDGGKALLMRGPGGSYFRAGRKVAFDYAATAQIRLDLTFEQLSRLQMSRDDDLMTFGMEDNFQDLENNFRYLFEEVRIRFYKESPIFVVEASDGSEHVFDSSVPHTLSLRVNLQNQQVSIYIDNTLVDRYQNSGLPTEGVWYHELNLRVDGGETVILLVDDLQLRAENAEQQFDLLSKYSTADPRLASYRVEVGEDLEVYTDPVIPDSTPWKIDFLGAGSENFSLSGVGGGQLTQAIVNYPIAFRNFTLALDVGFARWTHRRTFNTTCPPETRAFLEQAADCDQDGLSNEAESPGRGIDGDGDGTYDFFPIEKGADISVPNILLEYDTELGIFAVELNDRIATVNEQGFTVAGNTAPRRFPQDMFSNLVKTFQGYGIQILIDWGAVDSVPKAVLNDAFDGYTQLVGANDGAGLVQSYTDFASNTDLGEAGAVCTGTSGSRFERSQANCAAILRARSQVYRYALVASDLEG